MGIFDIFKGLNGVASNKPTPCGEAWMDNSRQVWLQNYKVYENGTYVTKRYMYNGTQWVEDTYVDTNTSPKPLGEAVQGTDGIWRQDYSVFENGTWVVKKYMYNGTQWVEDAAVVNYNTTNAAPDILNKIPDTQSGINLKKHTINLDKSLIDLSKKSGINLSKHRARVAVVMDYSGSMFELYSNGSVQRLLNRLMPLALRFDDNGELDVWLFDDSSMEMPSMHLGNFDRYIETVTDEIHQPLYGTKYAPVLEDVLSYYFIENIDTSCPVFVIFITDGENFDKRDAEREIIKSSHKDVFIQFVGIGDEKFKFLRKLDDLQGRPVDNTGFIQVRDFEKLSDEEVYNKLLDQYPEWLQAKGIK